MISSTSPREEIITEYLLVLKKYVLSVDALCYILRNNMKPAWGPELNEGFMQTLHPLIKPEVVARVGYGS